jgi:hypothetical protein
VEEEKTDRRNSTSWRVLKRISRVIETERVVRYVFTMSFHTRQDLTKLDQVFKEVAGNWTKKFGFRPMYEISKVSNIAFTYLFTIFTDDPRKILTNRPKFMEDIIRRVFQSSPQVK